MTEKIVCFVLMPFADKYLEVYEQVYKPVCESNSIKCWRVDEISRPGSITRDIVQGIIDSDIIIADLTSQNPNVFYELGIAHSVGNKTIMTCQSTIDVPFDIANYRVILYDQTIAGSKTLAKKLSAAIKELLSALDRTNNPVQSVLGNRTALHFKQKIPIFKAVDYNLLTPAFKELLTKHHISYIDQLKQLDIEKLVNAPGFGKSSISQLVHLIVAYDLYDDAVNFQKFIQKYGIKVSSAPDPYSEKKWYAFIESVRFNLRAG